MSELRLPNEFNSVALQQIVASKNLIRRKDAPKIDRLTASTFPVNASILDWALRGELVKAVDNYNKGGVYNPAQSEFLHREYWLCRIFDVMEDLGQDRFEKIIPGIWGSVLKIYAKTFSEKIVQVEVNSTEELYAEVG